MSFVDFASPTKSVLGADSWPDEAIHTIQRERQLRAEAESHAQARWEELRAVEQFAEAVTEEADLLRRRNEELEQELVRASMVMSAQHKFKENKTCENSTSISSPMGVLDQNRLSTASLKGSCGPSTIVPQLVAQLQEAVLESQLQKKRADALQAQLDKLTKGNC